VGSFDSSRKYIGEEADDATGLNYLNARYYNSKVGQFVSQDPAFLDIGASTFEKDYSRKLEHHLMNPQALNSYSYALNNPIRYKDSEGEVVPIIIAGALVLTEIGLSLYDVYSTAKTISNPNASFGEKFTSGGLTVIGFALPGAGYGAADDVAKLTKNGMQATQIAKQTGWANARTLADHYTRHGSDFGSKSAQQYAQSAQDFFQQAQRNGLPTKVDGDTVRIYDSKTNTFGSYTSSGQTKTFYKPDPAQHGYKTNADYWKAQKGKLKDN
jgi:RHS repeat-associated protein